MIFKTAPNSDSHLLQRHEYQFFGLECICVLGAMGVFSWLLGVPDPESI